jgi:hypothetical protein
MAEVLAEFTDVLVDDAGLKYRARACGAEMPDGTWQGWLEFIPLDGSPPIRSGRETTQPNRVDAIYWATGLTPIYQEGALQRALKPLVRRHVVPDEPAFQEPAPIFNASSVTSAAGPEAVLNPFSIYEKGEAVLRSQLAALSAWHLVNVIEKYRLNEQSPVVLNRLPATALIDMIVSAAAAEHAERPRRVSRRVSS